MNEKLFYFIFLIIPSITTSIGNVKNKVGKILLPIATYTTVLSSPSFSVHDIFAVDKHNNNNIYSNAYAADNNPNSLDQYLVRDISFPSIKKTMTLRQGFAVNRGEVPAIGGGDRTGTYTWPGGIELAQNVIDHKLIDVTNKRVIDLGTGTGIVGISAVWTKAKEVALTDGALEVLRIARNNIETNLKTQLSDGDCEIICSSPKKITNSIGLGRLRWGNNDDIAQWLQWRDPSPLPYDIVVASEVAYEHRSIDALLSTIKQLLDPVEGVAILRGTPEITDDSKGFKDIINKIKKFGFDIIYYPDTPEYVNSQLVIIQIHKQ